MKSFLPIKVKYCPMKKLALIPFENNPDKLYKCLELQYFDSEVSGTGYRIIAYRNDNYLDVINLIFDNIFKIVTPFHFLISFCFLA